MHIYVKKDMLCLFVFRLLNLTNVGSWIISCCILLSLKSIILFSVKVWQFFIDISFNSLQLLTILTIPRSVIELQPNKFKFINCFCCVATISRMSSSTKSLFASDRTRSCFKFFNSNSMDLSFNIGQLFKSRSCKFVRWNAIVCTQP